MKFSYSKKKIILVSLCKTMQIHFISCTLLHSIFLSVCSNNSCFLCIFDGTFVHNTNWQCQTKAQATSWSIHRYDCFSFFFFFFSFPFIVLLRVELSRERKLIFVFVPSRQYFISMNHFVWHSLRFLFWSLGLTIKLKEQYGHRKSQSKRKRESKKWKKNATTTRWMTMKNI